MKVLKIGKKGVKKGRFSSKFRKSHFWPLFGPFWGRRSAILAEIFRTDFVVCAKMWAKQRNCGRFDPQNRPFLEKRDFCFIERKPAFRTLICRKAENQTFFLGSKARWRGTFLPRISKGTRFSSKKAKIIKIYAPRGGPNCSKMTKKVTN